VLQQKATELVDHGSFPADPAVPDAVQSLQIQLGLTLHRNEAHGRPLHSLSNRFCNNVVVLVGLDERPDILGRHQLHLMTVLQKSTGEEVGAGTGFDADQAGRHVHRVR